MEVKLENELLRKLSRRSDAQGLIQCLGVMLVAVATGAFTFFAWRSGYWFVALLGLIAHGNVFSLFIAGLHELSHGTVFKTRWLNDLFANVFGFLCWMTPGDYFKAHKEHHSHTLHHDDVEREVTCRPLWFGTWIWSATINLPKMFFTIFNNSIPVLFISTHAVLAILSVLIGFGKEWLLFVAFAPFYFGWLELILNYTQHGGMKVDSDDMRESTRSIRLPRWLSFLYWRMEYHLEHHLYPSVPCYRLPELRHAISDQLPPRRGLIESWVYILRHRNKGECGHGDGPLNGIFTDAPTKTTTG